MCLAVGWVAMFCAEDVSFLNEWVAALPRRVIFGSQRLSLGLGLPLGGWLSYPLQSWFLMQWSILSCCKSSGTIRGRESFVGYAPEPATQRSFSLFSALELGTDINRGCDNRRWGTRRWRSAACKFLWPRPFSSAADRRSTRRCRRAGGHTDPCLAPAASATSCGAHRPSRLAAPGALRPPAR